MAGEELVEQVEKIVEEMGFLLVDLNLVQAGRRRLLRLLVDREGRITVDECASVSRAVGNAVETLDLIQGAYTLEVSSPGIGRPLTAANDWIRCRGRKIEVKTSEGEYTGTLAGHADGVLSLEDGTGIPMAGIISAREVI